MKKNTKKTEKQSKTATAKAVEYVLDTKQNHSMRKRLESEGVDAFVLHAFDKLSAAYVAFCVALFALGKVIVGESVTLFCNGVTERISYDKATGNYSRIVGNGKAIYGNVALLVSLYGKDAVHVMTDAEVSAAFDGVKEQTTRKLGDGRTITGRVISKGKKGDMILEIVAVKLDNGKIALHNLEDKTNSHQRKLNRFAIVQTTNAKSEKKGKTTKSEAKKETASAEVAKS